MNCPDCSHRMSIVKTANFTGRSLRVEECACGGRFETETKVIRRLPPTISRQKPGGGQLQMSAGNLRGISGSGSDLSSGSLRSPIEGDQEVDREAPATVEYPNDFETLWDRTGKRGGKFKAFKAWKARGKPTWTEVESRWNAYLASDRPVAGFVQDLSTWINGRGFLQDWEPASAQPQKRNGTHRDVTIGHARAQVTDRPTGEVKL